MTGLFFLLANQYENNDSSLNNSSAGLLSIGTLDLFHAIVDDSNTFVWLRTLASTMGAVGFSLIWFHNWFRRFKVHSFIPLILFSLSLFLAIGSMFYPNVPPVMIKDGIFTGLALNMHWISGSIFLLASLNHFFMPQESLNERNIFLGSFCFLQFLAALLFGFCNIWTLEWWWWHLLRSIAGIVLIFYVFYLQIKLQKRLELAITLRDEFIAIASHELKTPLSAMKLQTQMLQKYNGQKEKFEWITSMFNKEINRVTKVVDELLEISRITSNQLSLNRSKTNLGAVVKEVISLLQEEFESSKQS